MSKKRLAKMLLWLTNLMLPFVAAGFGATAWRIVTGASLNSARWWSFLLGAVAFVPVWLVGRTIAPRITSYLTTLEHELTHIVVGLVFLKRPLSIRVTATEGGQVTLSGGNIWITLAPYFLPTLTVLLLPFDYFLGAAHDRAFLMFLGGTLAYHLLSTWTEVGVVQSDFREAGILQSLWLLPVVALIFYGAVLAHVAGGFGGFLSFFGEGARGSYTYLRSAWHALVS